MVLFPRKNKEYWIVTDLWETFCAIPVTLIRKGGLFDYGNGAKGLFIVRWQITKPRSETGDAFGIEEGYAEEYDATRRELFKTRKAAARLAERLNREAKQC